MTWDLGDSFKDRSHANLAQMPVRIVTWNVNGIRNPFKYSPWNKERNLQEVKTAKANLTDDLVFVPGWDTFYSFPQSQTGVAVFTRDRKCMPIRVEEGLTGTLRIPGSTVRYVDLPADEQIGGYPTDRQLLPQRRKRRQKKHAAVPREVLDSEGRCLVLEFPLFVLINVYCPARRNQERTGFRNSFLVALDARVRNLAAAGKNVVLVGDMNVMRDHLDSAEVWGHRGRKLATEALAFDERYMMLRSVRLLNRLIFHSREVGVNDGGGEDGVDDSGRSSAGGSLLPSPLPPPILYDTCRERFPHRKGMYTCWDTRKNHRPANYGSRIDFVLCSPKIMQRLVADANIQPEFLGSDHCPVYMDLHDHIQDELEKEQEQGQGSGDVFVLDYLNPPGRFVQGAAVMPADKEAALLSKRFPQSARRLAQFNNRRHIANMFKQTTKPELLGASAAAGATLSVLASVSASTPASQTQQQTNADAAVGAAAANVCTVRNCLPDILRADLVELVDLSGEEDDDDDDDDNQEDDQKEDLDDEAGHGSGGAGELRLDGKDRSDVPVQASTEKSSAGDVNSMQHKSDGDDFVDVLPNGPLPSQSQSQSDWLAPRRPSLLRSYSSAISQLPSSASAAPASAPRSRLLKRPKLSATASSKGNVQLTIGMFLLPRDKGPGENTVNNTSKSGGDSGDGGSNSHLNVREDNRPTTDAAVHSSPQTPKRKRPMTPSPQKEPHASSFGALSPFQPPSDRIALTADTEGVTVPGLSPSPVNTADTAITIGTDSDSATATATTEPLYQHHRVQAAKTTWSQLGLGQQQVPLCEHGEPCKMLVTRKAGVNNGRSFYTCARPPGPLGRSEKGTAWQCPTFVWCRDWKPSRKD